MHKRYSSYTGVNQKWADQIPTHWKIKRLKGVFAMRKERNNPVQTDRILSLTAKIPSISGLLFRYFFITETLLSVFSAGKYKKLFLEYELLGIY